MVATALTIAQGSAFGAGVADVNYQAVDAVNDNSFANDGRTILLVVNGSGGALTPTLRVPATPRSANTAFNKALSAIADGDTAQLGPFPTEIYSSTVTIGWSTGSSVTAAPVRLAQTPL